MLLMAPLKFTSMSDSFAISLQAARIKKALLCAQAVAEVVPPGSAQINGIFKDALKN